MTAHGHRAKLAMCRLSDSSWVQCWLKLCWRSSRQRRSEVVQKPFPSVPSVPEGQPLASITPAQKTKGHKPLRSQYRDGASHRVPQKGEARYEGCGDPSTMRSMLDDHKPAGKPGSVRTPAS